MWILKHSGESGIPNTHKVLISSALKGGEKGAQMHSLHLVGLEPKTHMGALDH
jgi:hypothetical protein